MRGVGRDIDIVRVAIVAESSLPRVNGVSGSVLRTSRHLVRRGHEVAIIAPDPAPQTSVDGVTVHTVRSISLPGMGFDVGYATTTRLAALLAQLEPDVVHLASPLVLGRQALRAARGMGLPTVAVFQTDISGFARHYRLGAAANLSDSLIRRIHLDADLTLAPSSAALGYLTDVGVERIRIWGRGVDADQFHPGRRCTSTRHRWTAGAEKIIVGFVGRLAPEKRVSMLTSLEIDPRYQIVIVGDGPQRSELQALLPSAVLTGLLKGDALGTAMASMDILVAPGENETFCQVIQEGMAAGVPVVAPSIGGPRDLVRHGETGLLYAPGSSTALVRAVDALAVNAESRTAMGRRARQLVSGRTWERIGDELIGHYDAALNGVVDTGISTAA